jgi:hypothetical protein
MVGRYMAGAARLPFMPLRSYLGADQPKVNPRIQFVDSPYGDGPIAVVPPLNPDVAIIHAQRADANGNTQLWGLLGVQKEVAFAAQRVIVVVEEIVDEATIRSDPNRTAIPGKSCTGHRYRVALPYHIAEREIHLFHHHRLKAEGEPFPILLLLGAVAQIEGHQPDDAHVLVALLPKHLTSGNDRVTCPLCQGKVKKLMSTFSGGASGPAVGGMPDIAGPKMCTSCGPSNSDYDRL